MSPNPVTTRSCPLQSGTEIGQIRTISRSRSCRRKASRLSRSALLALSSSSICSATMLARWTQLSALAPIVDCDAIRRTSAFVLMVGSQPSLSNEWDWHCGRLMHQGKSCSVPDEVTALRLSTASSPPSWPSAAPCSPKRSPSPRTPCSLCEERCEEAPAATSFTGLVPAEPDDTSTNRGHRAPLFHARPQEIGASATVTLAINVTAADANSFRASQRQIVAEIARAIDGGPTRPVNGIQFLGAIETVRVLPS
jgi:hypothetical protein